LRLRTLVRAGTIVEVEKRVQAMSREGWTAITPVKLDDSMMAYNRVDYICVMERPEDHIHSNKKKWGRGY
jgi:hypothetical protein